MVFVFVVWQLLSGCGSETDSGMQNALDSGHVTADLNEADGFNPPQGSLTINDGVVATNQTDVTLKLDASDAVGVTAYYVSSQSANPTTSDSNWNSITSVSSFSKQVSETISAVEKSHSLYAWFRDSVGGTSTQASASIIYDSTAPTVSSVSINSGDSTTTNTVVSLTISASDSLSGITAYYASESSTAPSSSSTDWADITATNSLSTTKSYTLSSPGQVGTFTKIVYLWVKDSAGNVSDSASDSIQLIITDQSAPTNPSISINSGASSTASSSVTLSLSATDDIGVTGYYLSQTSSTPSSSASGWTSVTSAPSYSASVSYTLSGGNGTNTVYVWFKDSAGNVSSSDSDSITLQDDPPSNPSISINSGASSTVSSSVTLSLSATDDVGVTSYYIRTCTGTDCADSGWITVTSTTSYSASVSHTLTGGSGLKTVYVWFGDSAGNVSSEANDSITYYSIPNIYCGLINSSTGGTSALFATKLTSGSVRTTTLSSSSSNYYFFFGASSSSTYTIAWSGNAYHYTVYKGVGNQFYYSSTDDDSATISSYTGDVVIKFDPYNSGETVSFSITGGSIVDYHADKNSYCQSALSLSANALTATSISTGRVYQATLSSGSSNYYAKFSASSSSTYTIAWSGNAYHYTVYKGVGNQFYYSSTDDDSTTISNYSGDVIIKFDPYNSGEIVGFMVHEE